jgi:hypothetical protein
MKTVFDAETRDELTRRIELLNENSSAAWGRMNVYRMVKHCTIWNAWMLGTERFEYRQAFFGKIFGKLALRNNTKDDRPIGKGMPAGKSFLAKEQSGDLELEKSLLAKQIADYGHFSNDRFIHDFFGKMTKEQIGIFVYKHHDHHLRQFGV